MTIRPPLSRYEIEAQCGAAATAAAGDDGGEEKEEEGEEEEEEVEQGGREAEGGRGGGACASSCALAWEPGLGCWEVVDTPFEGRAFGFKAMLDALQAPHPALPTPPPTLSSHSSGLLPLLALLRPSRAQYRYAGGASGTTANLLLLAKILGFSPAQLAYAPPRPRPTTIRTHGLCTRLSCPCLHTATLAWISFDLARSPPSRSELRSAMVAWMVAGDDHSWLEIMLGADAVLPPAERVALTRRSPSGEVRAARAKPRRSTGPTSPSPRARFCRCAGARGARRL